MARRMKQAMTFTALIAVVTSGLAVAVNLATEWKTDPWAWLAVVVLTAGAAVVSWKNTTSDAGTDNREVLANFIALSRSRWEKALRHRGPRADLIEVPWETHAVGTTTVNSLMERKTSRDHIEATARVLLDRRLRLFVTGPAGAGKSSLARRIALACARSRTEDAPIPVVVSASSWWLAEPVPLWLERELVEVDRSLTGRSTDGRTFAHRLVDDNQVFPVVDGLDELPEEPRAMLVEALRDSLPDDMPLLVTCRTAEAADPHDVGAGLPLDAVLVMGPLVVDDIAAVLRHGATRAQSDRWDAVLHHAREEPDSPVAQALSRPLMAALASEIYRGEGDPGELLHVDRHPDRAAVEDHLLGSYLPTVLRLRRNNPDTSGPRFSDEAVLRGLSFLARHLERLRTYEFRWWEQRAAISTHALARQLSVRPPQAPQRMFPLHGRFLLSWLRAYLRAFKASALLNLARGAAVGFTVSVLMAAALWVTSRISPEIARQIATGGDGFMPPLPQEDSVGLLVSMTVFLGVGAALAIPAIEPLRTDQGETLKLHQAVRLDAAVNPRQLLTQDRSWSLWYLAVVVAWWPAFIHLSASGPFGLSRWFAHTGVFTALLIVGSVYRLFSVAEWPWFVVARVPLTLSGRLPLRLIGFLDEMDNRDILRREGDVYRFRHAALRDWLLRRDAEDRYHSLGLDEQRLLRRLTMWPGTDFTAEFAAHLAASPTAAAQLKSLCQAKMLMSDDDRYHWRPNCRHVVDRLARTTETAGVRERVVRLAGSFYTSLDDWRLLHAERHNVVATFAHADQDTALELVLLLAPHLVEWELGGWGRDVISRLLELDLPDTARLELRYWLAVIDPICARRHCAEALWLAKTLGSPEFGVRALSVMAFAHVPDEPEEALRVASSAVADAARLGADVHARALINLGWIELTTGSGCPRNEFLRALSIAQRTGHRDLVVKARWGVGLTTTDLTHATTWLRSAVRMGRGIGLFRTSAHVALDLAMVLRQRRRSEADRVLDEVLTYALEVEDYLFAASVQWDKAGYLRAAGAYQAARHAYDKAREIWAEHDEPHAAAVTSVTIAAMLLDAIDHDPRREQVLGQRIATAREHLTTALVAFTEQLDDPHWAAVTSDLLGRLETKAGDLVEAAVRYEAAEEIRSIMNKE